MKNPTRPTRRQKILLERLGYDPSKYLIHWEGNNAVCLIEKDTGKAVVVDKI
jgi:ABC-type bacteriocin/lantibiotic exporter with double-glycine peptidase domain